MVDTKNREDKIDQQYDDGFNRRQLRSAEQTAGEQSGSDADFNNIANNYDKTADPSQEDKNIQSLRGKDDAAGLNDSGWKTNVSGNPRDTKAEGRFSFVRRKGPLAFLSTLIIGGGLLGFSLLPLGPISLVETFTNDTDDSAAWTSSKVNKIYADKLSSVQKKAGYCGTKITIRCKFSTMSKWQTAKFEKLEREGLLRIEGKETKFGGRTSYTGLTFINPTDGSEVNVRNPSQYQNALRQHIHVRSTTNRIFNPITSKFTSNGWSNFLSSKGLSLGKKITGNSREETRESYRNANSNSDSGGEESNKVRVDNSEASGDSDEAKDNRQQNSKFANEIKSSIRDGKSSVKIGGGPPYLTAARGVCAAYTIGNIVDISSKTLKAARLMEFAMIFLTGVNSIQAGDATQAETEQMTDVLFPSTYPAKVEAEVEGELKMIDNPDIGKNALDSEAYKMAAHGDNNSLSELTKKFMIGGGLPGALGLILDKVNERPQLKSTIRNGCKAANSKIATVLSYAAVLTGLPAVIVAAVGFAAGKALEPFLTKLLDVALTKSIAWAAGKDLTTDIIGPAAGNALYVGTTLILGGYSSWYGMRPGKADEIVNNMVGVKNTQDSYIATQQYDARDTPLDASNRYSFLGSILWSARGTSATSGDVVKNIFTQTAQLLNPNKLVATASAGGSIMPVQNYTAERFKMCPDEGYEQVGMDADKFCSPRYVPFDEVEIDAVHTYMLANEYIDDETGEPLPDSDYAEWTSGCAERYSGWGDDQEDLDGGESGAYSDGKACVNDGKKNTFFANWRAYVQTQEATDDEPTLPETETPSTGESIRVATFNIYHAPDPLNGVAWKNRLNNSVKTLKENSIDIAGLQETRPDQQRLLRTAEYGGDTYDMYPESSNNVNAMDQNADSVVIWDKSKYSKVSGTQKLIKYNGGRRKVNIVKLASTAGQEFYVLNTHDPIDAQSQSGNGPQDRKDNNELYYNLVKNELTDAPVIFTGDFNSKFTVESSRNKPLGNLRENLAYCILTRDNILVHASDSQKGDTGCKSSKDVLGRNDVDHIFISPELEASNYSMKPRGGNKNGGDHDMVFADVAFPGSSTGGVQNGGEGITFTIGTYNQKRSLSLAQHEGAANNIVEKNMDVVGTQETSNPKYSNYKSYLSGKNYGVYPTSAGPNQTCSNAQSIFYNKATFRFIKGEYFEIPRYPDPAVNCGNGEQTTASHNIDGLPEVWTHIPVVWLQGVEKDQTVIVINAHNVANVASAAGTRPAKSRFQSAKIFIEQIKRLKAENPGVPIFFTGDFNEGTNVRTSGNVTWQGKQSNLFFCMVADSGLMKSADGPAMKCDPSYGIGPVDYIYTTPEVKIDWVREIGSGGKDSGAPSFSDHPVRYASVTVPGSPSGPGGESQAGWVWPIKAAESKAGPCYGGSSVHAGLDINSNSNSIVYAMHSGEVVNVVDGVNGRLPSTGNHVMVRTATGVYYGYQHLMNGSILVKEGDTVSAEQPLAKMGKTGNVSLGSSATHLHVTMATTNTTGQYGSLGTTFDPMRHLSAVKPAGYSCT